MSDDYILSLLKEMKSNCKRVHTLYTDPLADDKAQALNYAIYAVEHLNVKRGRWVDNVIGTMQNGSGVIGELIEHTCSLCGGKPDNYNGDRYCPNCGAKMDEVTT